MDERDPEPDISPLYGYCPRCGAIAMTRERRPNGNDQCYAGHVYPSTEARSRRPAGTRWRHTATRTRPR